MIAWTDYPIGDHRVMCVLCGKRPTVKDMGITILDASHGIAHCFRCRVVLRRQEDKELTPEQRKAYAQRMDALRRQHEAEQHQRQADAAVSSAIRWAAAKPAGDHPYLQAKSVQARGIRIEGHHTLLVPLRDAEGRLHSLQSIAPDGTKRFTPGGRTKGCYYSIGNLGTRLVICEGFATGATIHDETGHAVAVAFNAGNLLPVARVLRAKFPSMTLVLAADDDWQTEGNPGLTAATEAARAVGGLLAVPDFAGLPRGKGDSDFNDLNRLFTFSEVSA